MENPLDTCGDTSFGPQVQFGCRGGFDFTLLFEEIILSILPAAFFLFLAPLRAARLQKKAIKVRRNSLRIVKLGATIVYAALQLILLVLWSNTSSSRTRFSIVSSALNFTVALCLILLSYLEHTKSIRPSFLISVYLLISLIFDVARVRTQWLLIGHSKDAIVGSASAVAKIVVLGLEAVDKRNILLATWREISPENTSSMVSRGLFWWLNALLVRGFKSIMSVDDLYSINKKLSSEKLHRVLQSQWNNCKKQRKNALAWVTFMGLRWDIFVIVLPRLSLVAFNVSQPFLINRAIKFIDTSETIQPNNIGYGLIGAFALVYVGTAHLTFRLMTMIRGSLIAMIYQKMLNLKSSENESAAMTLMGTDVERIVETWHLLLIESWSNLIQLGIGIWLLEQRLGAVCIAPIIVVLVATGLSMKIATYMTKRQKAWLEAIEKRINFTSEILGSMIGIKMLGLTEQMVNIIQGVRVEEMESSKRFRSIYSLNLCVVNTPSTLIQLLTFVAFAIVSKLQGNSSITTSLVITSLSILGLIDMPLGQLVGAIPQGYAALGCFQRIQAFLLLESYSEQRQITTGQELVSPTEELCIDNTALGNTNIELDTLPHRIISHQNKYIVAIQGGIFGWSELRPPILDNIHVRIPEDSLLTIVIGAVGCGKSTLLRAILGETLLFKGVVKVRHRDIAFCDQTPWIINASVRENVIGESPFDSAWYSVTLHACSLDTDMLQMPDGDHTLLGSKGIILSGGQKSRLAMARAIYSRKRIMVFDDIFSGLDTVTEGIVFSRVFGETGLLRQTGTTAILATHGVHRLAEADHIIVLGVEGRILEQGTYKSLTCSGEYVQSIAQTQHNIDPAGSVQNEVSSAPRDPTESVPIANTQENTRQTGDWRIYKYYFSSLGWMNLLIFGALIASSSVLYIVQFLWLNWWSQSTDSATNSHLAYWLGILTLFGSLQVLAFGAGVFYLYVLIVPKSGSTLHWGVLKAAMRAPMRLFTATDTGVLVNRFSQDMRLVDMTLPGALANTTFQLADLSAAIGLIIGVVGYFAIAIPVILAVLVTVQRFYLRTSRQLRLLEIETKAPLYAHFIESLRGIVTIRAFGWTEAYQRKNLRLLDKSQKPFYLLLCIQRWLVLVLDLVVAGMAILLITLAVVLRSKMNAGLLGLVLVNMTYVGFAMAGLINSWTHMETSLGAISRIKEFSEETPCEMLEGENMQPEADWPLHGALDFKGVTATYSAEAPPVLDNINLSIKPGEKIGICGRTGSGKSSFILAILRLLDLKSGQIILDSHDLATLPRPLIREKITCLIQEPFLFSGSIRLNIDPYLSATDVEIIESLEKVGLWNTISNKAGTAGLDAVISTTFFSQGQKQLFSLARALLRKSKILILDEPTSSVDSSTDAKMQEIVRAMFSSHTIIMVAHRLDSLLDFDRVLVLDKGRMVELGNPRELLQVSGSRFARLYRGRE